MRVKMNDPLEQYFLKNIFNSVVMAYYFLINRFSSLDVINKV